MLFRLKAYQEAYAALPKSGRDGYLHMLDTDKTVRAEVKALSRHFLHLEMTNCGHCYLEGHLRLMKIKTENMTEKTLDYELYNGTLLHDPINKNIDLRLTPHTLLAKGEELALYHIAYNKNALKFFTKYPDDLEARIEKFLKGQKTDLAVVAKAAGDARLSILRAQVAQATEVFKQAAKAFKEADAVLKKAQEALAAVDTLKNEANDTGGEKPSGKDKAAKAKKGAEANDTGGDAGDANSIAEAVDYIQIAKGEVGEFVAAGMAEADIEAAFAEAIAEGKITAEEVSELIAEAHQSANTGQE